MHHLRVQQSPARAPRSQERSAQTLTSVARLSGCLCLESLLLSLLWVALRGSSGDVLTSSGLVSFGLTQVLSGNCCCIQCLPKKKKEVACVVFWVNFASGPARCVISVSLLTLIFELLFVPCLVHIHTYLSINSFPIFYSLVLSCSQV